MIMYIFEYLTTIETSKRVSYLYGLVSYVLVHIQGNNKPRRAASLWLVYCITNNTVSTLWTVTYVRDSKRKGRNIKYHGPPRL